MENHSAPHTLAPFSTADISHFANCPAEGNAAWTEIPPEAFDSAEMEVSGWDGYAETPLVNMSGMAGRIGVDALFFKDESKRFTLRSFKASGGAYAVVRLLQRELSQKLGRKVETVDILAGRLKEDAAEFTIVASTDGNHGRSVAWGASRCGAKCRIYISTDVSAGRAEAMQALGATVVRTEGGYAKSAERVRLEAEEYGWHLANDTATPGYEEVPGDILAGYGIMAREVTRQLPAPPTHVFLQAAVGGMASAVASVFVQRWGDIAPRVIIMETEHAANLLLSAQRGEPTEIDVHVETIMGGLSCGEISTTAWKILSEVAQDFVTVPDSVVGPAMRLLARPPFGDPEIEAGETGVAGLCAALCIATQAGLRERIGLTEGSRILVIGTEGMTDPEIYRSIVGI